LHQTTKRHTLAPNLVEQIVWRCGSNVVLTLYGCEKKSTRESPLENRVVYNTTSLSRRRDHAILSGTIGFYGDDLLLVINCTRGRILHPFPRYSLRQVQHRYIWLPLLRLTPDGGVPWDDLSKILRGSQQ